MGEKGVCDAKSVHNDEPGNGDSHRNDDDSDLIDQEQRLLPLEIQKGESEGRKRSQDQCETDHEGAHKERVEQVTGKRHPGLRSKREEVLEIVKRQPGSEDFRRISVKLIERFEGVGEDEDQRQRRHNKHWQNENKELDLAFMESGRIDLGPLELGFAVLAFAP